MEIAAEAVIPAPEESVFEFLSDLENHWLLADRFIEVVSLDRVDDGPAKGGCVRMRGPFGIRRTAATRVVETQPPTRMSGVAELSGGTEGRVSWTLTPRHSDTHVRLSAQVASARFLDRLLLAAGGRRWFRRRFGAILETLASHFRKERLADEENSALTPRRPSQV